MTYLQRTPGAKRELKTLRHRGCVEVFEVMASHHSSSSGRDDNRVGETEVPGLKVVVTGSGIGAKAILGGRRQVTEK